MIVVVKGVFSPALNLSINHGVAFFARLEKFHPLKSH